MTNNPASPLPTSSSSSSSSSPSPQEIQHQQHLIHLHQTINLAKQSPPKPTNFRVGCVLVSNPSSSTSSSSTVLSTGYTLELPGNTHAEQCALFKLALNSSVLEDELHTILTREANVTLYTSLEPCGKRLSGNLPCVQRIIATRKEDGSGIQRVVFGAKEPGTFVRDSQSCRLLSEAGIEWEYIPDLEEEILTVAMEGHNKEEKSTGKEVDVTAGSERQNQNARGTNIKDIDEEERKRQEALPRNPKKRMMEVDVPPT